MTAVEPRQTAQVALVELCERVVQLTPEEVITEAVDPESPLHGYFEWDDTAAGARYRLLQASALIRRCRITIQTAPETTVRVRQFMHVPAEVGPGYYDRIEQVLADGRRDVVMEQAVRELAAFRRKYDNLVDVDQAWQAAATVKPRRPRAHQP